MEIIELRIMRGPNYWSVDHPKIIVMRLDLENYKDIYTNEISGFFIRLKKMFPGMQSHQSGEGVEGGFFKNVRKGIRLSQVVQHIALELQNLSGMDCGFGRTIPTSEKGLDNVIFSYSEERAGEYAAYAAVKITEALVKDARYNLKRDVDR